MHLQKVKEILSRQKMVEDIVHVQSMPRHAMVETLVHRQHLAELKNLLEPLAAEDIAAVLEALDGDSARIVWSQIPDELANNVLWEVSDPCREQLVGDREPSFGESQICAFELSEGKLDPIPIRSRKDFDSKKPVWIDLINVTKAERNFVGQHFGLKLSDPGDATDLEVSSRFQVEKAGAIHLHSNFLLDRAGSSRSVPVAFVLHKGILFTLRNEELPVFRLQRLRAHAQPGYVTDCFDLVLDLYGADVEYSADSLEDIYLTLGKVGRQVLSEAITDEEAASILGDIAEEEDLNGRIRGNILDTQRAINFLMRCRALSEKQIEESKQVLRNIESLNSHTSFLFDKINFLMDATIGFININQNRRINKLTVFGVVFMPINILAGMGGMSEFSMMTQGIPWPLAYGMFFAVSCFMGAATYVGLKHFEKKEARATKLVAGRTRALAKESH
ncbi:MAG: magnesium transporter CorA [Burkholderiales bacterium PBB4]|nr:MAG: magnesium transporter CorA [Burkholderiales bacterium PBB4]